MYKIQTFTLSGDKVLDFKFKDLPTVGQPWLTLDTSNSKIVLRDTPTIVYDDDLNIYDCWYDECKQMYSTFFSSVNDAFILGKRTLVITTTTSVPIGFILADDIIFKSTDRKDITYLSIDDKVMFFSNLNFQVIVPKKKIIS